MAYTVSSGTLNSTIPYHTSHIIQLLFIIFITISSSSRHHQYLLNVDEILIM